MVAVVFKVPREATAGRVFVWRKLVRSSEGLLTNWVTVIPPYQPTLWSATFAFLIKYRSRQEHKRFTCVILENSEHGPHYGPDQDIAGNVIETSRGLFYSGLGANAVGAGSPTVPGIVSQFHFADAIFQPRIAQRTACARQAGAEVTTNDLAIGNCQLR